MVQILQKLPVKNLIGGWMFDNLKMDVILSFQLTGHNFLKLLKVLNIHPITKLNIILKYLKIFLEIYYNSFLNVF